MSSSTHQAVTQNTHTARRILHWAILLAVCAAPGLLLSVFTEWSPWTLFRLARVNLSIQADRILDYRTAAAAYRAEHIGTDLVVAALLRVSGISSVDLAILPVGSLLLAVVYYAVARIISGSRSYAAATMLYASWYYPRLVTQYGVQTYVWTNALFLVFIVLFWLWLERRSSTVSFLIIFVFVALFLHYQTTPIWAIVLLSVGALFTMRQRAPSTSRTQGLWALPVFCMVLYFSFDTVVYGNGLARLKNEAITESLVESFVNRLVVPLFSRPTDAASGFEYVVITPWQARASTLLVLVLLTGPVAFWILTKVYQVIRHRDLSLAMKTREDVFIWSVVAAAISHTLMYMLYGAISLRVIPLLFVFTIPLVFQQFPRMKDWGYPIILIIAVAAAVGFVSYVFSLSSRPTGHGFGHADKLIAEQDHVLANPYVYGVLLVNATGEAPTLFDLVWLDSDKYRAVVGQQSIDENEFDVLAVDMSDAPVIAQGWRYFEPWTDYLNEIDRNPALNRVYDGDNLRLYQPLSKELPLYHLPSGSSVTYKNRSLSLSVLRMFCAVVGLFLAPGAILLGLIRVDRIGIGKDFSAVAGLSIGLSVAFLTFCGYVVNFTFMGLTTLIPFVLGSLMIVVGLRTIRRTDSLLPGRTERLWLWALLLVVLLWSLTTVAVNSWKVQVNEPVTELFLTQSPSKDGSVDINVVDTSGEPGPVSLLVELDGTEVAQWGPRLVNRDSPWVVTQEIPPSMCGNMLVVTMERNGLPLRQLHCRMDCLQ